MKTTKSIKLFICLFVMIYATHSKGQNNFRNGIEIDYSIGYSGILIPMDSISTALVSGPSSVGGSITTEKISPVRAFKYNVSVFKYFSKSFGMKFSFGATTYGFDFEGYNPSTLTKIKETYKAKGFDWGLSFKIRIPALNYGNILIEPGVRLSSNLRKTVNTVTPRQKDSFSFSGYLGYEIPMFGSHFFSNAGILFNIPLKKHSTHRYNNGSQYYPYYIGVRVAVNFQV